MRQLFFLIVAAAPLELETASRTSWPIGTCVWRREVAGYGVARPISDSTFRVVRTVRWDFDARWIMPVSWIALIGWKVNWRALY